MDTIKIEPDECKECSEIEVYTEIEAELMELLTNSLNRMFGFMEAMEVVSKELSPVHNIMCKLRGKLNIIQKEQELLKGKMEEIGMDQKIWRNAIRALKDKQ